MESGQEFLELTLKEESIKEVKLNLEFLKLIEEQKDSLLEKKLRVDLVIQKNLEKIEKRKRYELDNQYRDDFAEQLRFEQKMEREMEWHHEQEEELREERKREYLYEMRREEMEWRHEQEEMQREAEAEWRREEEIFRRL